MLEDSIVVIMLVKVCSGVDVSDLVKNKSNNNTWLLVNLMASLSEISGEKIFLDTDNKGNSKLRSEGCTDDCGSNEGSRFVNYLLSTKSKITVKGVSNGSKANEFGDIDLDAEQIYGVQQGLKKKGLNKKTASVGLVFLHEALHIVAGAQYYDSEEDQENKNSYGTFSDPPGGLIETYTLVEL